MKYSLDHREFRQVFSFYKSLTIGELFFRYNNKELSKLGIIVSKKYGNAVKRNLFKRRCRILFNNYFKNERIFLVVQPKNSTLSWKHLERSFVEFKVKTNG